MLPGLIVMPVFMPKVSAASACLQPKSARQVMQGPVLYFVVHGTWELKPQ